MSPEMEYFIYLIEKYAAYKDQPTGEIMQEWDGLGLTDLIYDMYERYHIERIENAFDDIDEMIIEKNLRPPDPATNQVSKFPPFVYNGKFEKPAWRMLQIQEYCCRIDLENAVRKSTLIPLCGSEVFIYRVIIEHMFYVYRYTLY